MIGGTPLLFDPAELPVPEQRRITFVGVGGVPEAIGLAVLMARPEGVSRDELQTLTDAPSTPDLIRRLRKTGLSIDMERRQRDDRHGLPRWRGWYTLRDPASRIAVLAWRGYGDLMRLYGPMAEGES